MTDNWWEDAPLAPASDPGFTGFIPGSPKPDKPADPLDVEAKQLGIQRTKQLIAKNADESGKTPEAKQAEQKAAYLATNMTANVALMNKALKTDPSSAKPTWGQYFSSFLGEDAKNSMLPEQRQVVENSQRLITDAALTLGTGAAYTKEQIEAYRRGFFPQIGDSESAIKAKREALRAALISARMQAGSQAPQIDAAMQQLGLDPNVDASPKTGGEPPAPGMGELSPEQSKAYKAFIAAHGGKPDPTQLKTFLENLTGKQINNADAIAAALAKGQGASTATLNITKQEKIRDRIERENKIGLGDNPATTLAMQGATLSLSDEAAGVGEAAANIVNSPFTGNFDPVSSYRFGRDVERTRIDDARQQLGYGGTGIELLSGMASAGPTNALAAFTPQQAVRAATSGGAVGGALAGFGSGEGSEQSLAGAAGGGVIGAAVGRYAPAVMDRASGLLPRRLRAPQGMAPDVANAAREEGVDLIRPMVDQNSVSDFGALESNVYSQSTIRGATARVRGQIEDRVEGLGDGGTPLDTEAAGSLVQGAGRRFIERSRGVANTLYNRARSLAGDATVTPRAALGQLRQELTALNETPTVNQGEIGFINELGQDLTSGPLSVEAIRNLRASVRGRINQSGLTATQVDARASRILDALQQDVQASLPPAAAQAFRRADAFYRERMTHIDDIVSRFLGPNDRPLSGEQAFQRLKTMTSPGGDSRRLAGLMRGLDTNERQDIAATIAQSLGRRAPDEPFSTALFLSQVRKLSPSAQRTMFGESGARSIDNLRLLSQRLEGAEQDINRSRSATVLERQGIRTAARAFIAGIAGMGGQAATGSLSGGLAGMAVAGGAMGASAARRVLSARAMVNPRVSMWLADAADVTTRAQAQEMTRRLGVIIAREPALAHELQGIYQTLQQRLAAPLAAEPEAEGNEDDQ